MKRIDKNTVKFFVDEKKRKVVCVIEDCKRDFIDFIINETHLDICDDLWGPIKDEYFMPKTFSGVATCEEGDEWNEEIGKLVALDKAKIKWGSSFFKRANLFMEHKSKLFNETCDIIDGFGKKLSQNCANRREKIEKYFAEVDKANESN